MHSDIFKFKLTYISYARQTRSGTALPFRGVLADYFSEIFFLITLFETTKARCFVVLYIVLLRNLEITLCLSCAAGRAKVARVACIDRLGFSSQQSR